MTPLPEGQRYTLADLLAWDDNTRYEMYNGQLVALAAPSYIHQMICMELSRQFSTYLFGKRCKVLAAPFDVQPFAEKDAPPETISTVVQPDLLIICDPEKTRGHGCKGAPDMVIEVLSPSTAQYDKMRKFNLYWQAGVREYWIVDPEKRIVSVYTLEDGIYNTATYNEDEPIQVGILDNCVINLSDVFSVI